MIIVNSLQLIKTNQPTSPLFNHESYTTWHTDKYTFCIAALLVALVWWKCQPSPYFIISSLCYCYWGHLWRVIAADASYPPSAARQRWLTLCRSYWSWRWTWREVGPTPLLRWNQMWWARVLTSLLSTATPTTSVFRVYWRLWSLRNLRRPEGVKFASIAFECLCFLTIK